VQKKHWKVSLQNLRNTTRPWPLWELKVPHQHERSRTSITVETLLTYQHQGSDDVKPRIHESWRTLINMKNPERSRPPFEKRHSPYKHEGSYEVKASMRAGRPSSKHEKSYEVKNSIWVKNNINSSTWKILKCQVLHKSSETFTFSILRIKGCHGLRVNTDNLNLSTWKILGCHSYYEDRESLIMKRSLWPPKRQKYPKRFRDRKGTPLLTLWNKIDNDLPKHEVPWIGQCFRESEE